MITTESFLERLKEVDPKMKLYAGQPQSVVRIEVPFEDMRRFMAGETQFTVGCAKDWKQRPHASFVKFVDAPWPVQLDEWLRKELPMTVFPMQNSMNYEMLVYLPKEKKNV